MNDPWRSYFGHPQLPCGYNADDNNGDEVDGAGTNWSVWPDLFDTYVGLTVLVITGDMMDVFATDCPDYIAPAFLNIITLPGEDQVLAVSGAWREIAFQAESNVIIFPQGSRGVKIRANENDTSIARQDDTLKLSQESQTHVVRRRS
jgi:hypothetical protein